MPRDDYRDVPFVDPIGLCDSITGSMGALDLPVEAGATKVMLQAETADFRFVLSGGDGPASVGNGFLLKAGAPPIVILLTPNMVLNVCGETATAVLWYQFGKG